MPAIFLKSATRREELPEGDKAHIAIVGRSNVGKSTLINQLTGQSALARVSATPGHTQSINIFEVDRRYYLIDLPGFGYAKTSKAQRADFEDMIADYLRETEQLKLVILVVDASIPPTELDQAMLSFLQSLELPTVIAMNKIDKLKKADPAKLTEFVNQHFGGAPYIAHSSVTGQGRGELNEAIARALRA